MKWQGREKQITKEQKNEENEGKQESITGAVRKLTRSDPGGVLRQYIEKGDQLDQDDCRPGGLGDYSSDYAFADIA